MRKIVTLFILIIPVMLIGQIELTEDSAKKLENSNKYVSSDFDEKEIEHFLTEKKFNFTFGAGAVFGTGSAGEYFGTYVSPEASYRLSPKFTISGGMTIYNSFGSPYSYPLSENSFGYPTGNFTQSFLYASGSYQVNNRLKLSGTVYKRINLFSDQNSYTGNTNNDYHGMIMGVDYKLGENVFIQGQIEISNDPYSRHSYPYSGFGSGFGGNHFNSYPPF
jgi:hypothetical protein